MDPLKVGQFIKEIRQKEGLTQNEFANLFGVTYQAVSKWETGKNIPDIAILTEICNKYHYDIQNFLIGKKKQNEKRKFIFILLAVFLFLLFCLFFLFSKDSFTFKTLSSNCDNFTLTGSMAYNTEKTSIYISDISYCGEKDHSKYVRIYCSLYENHENVKQIIDTCDFENKNSISLEEFLKNIKFQIDNYEKTCKNYTENSLHLEIDAEDKNGEVTTYKIPVKLEDNCS